MMGPSELGMLTRVWTGSFWVAASAVAVAADGRGPWVVVGRGSWLGLGFWLGWCCLGLCRCVCGVACARLGAGLGLGWGFGLGFVFRLRRTSVWRFEGAAAGSGVEGLVRAAAALAFAVALRMRAAGRGGSEDEVVELDEAEDEEKVVDAGWAVMRAGLWAVASAGATVGRMEGMSSGCRLGAGSWGGPVVTWRSGGPTRSAAAGEGGAGLWPFPSRLGWTGVLQCVRLCRLASAVGATVRVRCIQGPGGVGLSLLGCARGACAGHWVGWTCRGARGSSRWLCAGCRVWGVVRGVRRVGLWRACVGARAGGEDPCRGARGCA